MKLKLTVFIFHFIQSITDVLIIHGTENKNMSMLGNLLWKLENIQ